MLGFIPGDKSFFCNAFSGKQQWRHIQRTFWLSWLNTLSVEAVLNYSTEIFQFHSMESFELLDTRYFSCNEHVSVKLLFRKFFQKRKELCCRICINQLLILWERETTSGPHSSHLRPRTQMLCERHLAEFPQLQYYLSGAKFLFKLTKYIRQQEI